MKDKKILLFIILLLILPLKIKASSIMYTSNSSDQFYTNKTEMIVINANSSGIAMAGIGGTITSSNSSCVAINDVSSSYVSYNNENGKFAFLDKTGNGLSIFGSFLTISISTASVPCKANIILTPDSENTYDNSYNDVTSNGLTKSINVISPSNNDTNTNTNTTTNDQINTNTRTNTQTKELSNDASLKDIEISTENLTFDKDKDTYDLEVINSIKKIEIEGITNNANATVLIDGNTTLKEGLNIIKLIVTAEDKKTTKTYTINITKRERDLSNNSKIKSIKIENYNLRFQKNKREYELEISKEYSLTITVKLEDEFAKYEIEGNKNLKNNSIIKIKATAEDGTSGIYSIKIKKIEAVKDYSVFLIISIIITILLSGCMVYLIIKLNKNGIKVLPDFKKLFYEKEDK